MFNLDTSIHIVGHVLIAGYVEDLLYWWNFIYATSLIMPVFMRFHLLWLDSSVYQISSTIMKILIHCIYSYFMEIMILCISSSWRLWSIYIVHGDDHTCHILYHTYSWPLYSYVSETAISTCSYVQSLIIVLYYWMDSYSSITPLLGWNYNVFWPSYHPSDLTH